MCYSIGDPEAPQSDDKTFATRYEAEAAAIKASRAGDVIAIWDGNGMVVALVFDGDVYQS